MFALAFWLMLFGGDSSHAKMPELSSAISINIRIGWGDGWSAFERDHHIVVADSATVCTTCFRVDDKRTARTQIDTIPKATVAAFLQLLESIDLESKPYLPKFDIMDYDPYKEIRIKSPLDSLVIESWSQSGNGKPWQVILGADTLVSKSSAIHKSLALLKPYFHEDVLDSLVKAANFKH